LFSLCSNSGMTDRPASWRMPTPRQMEKLAAEAAESRPCLLRLRMRRFLPNIGIRCSRILAPARPASKSGSDHFLRSSVTCCASPAAAASASWKSRRSMRSASTEEKRSGKLSRSGCWMIPVSSGPGAMRTTGAGRISRRSRSGLPIRFLCAWMSRTTPPRNRSQTR
jgi:hypothetical protein